MKITKILTVLAFGFAFSSCQEKEKTTTVFDNSEVKKWDIKDKDEKNNI